MYNSVNHSNIQSMSMNVFAFSLFGYQFVVYGLHIHCFFITGHLGKGAIYGVFFEVGVHT